MKKKFLDSIEVKSPCNESWDEMFGNDEVRFCSHCAKNVHDISAMTRQKAEKLVNDSNGKLCVRYVKTPEGKLITAPPTLTKITRRATITAGVLATSLAFSTFTYAQGEPFPPKEKLTQTKKDKTQKDESKQGFATILGTVKDANDAVIVGARIYLLNTKTKGIRLLQSNDAGIYEFEGVEPGVYGLTAESPGFKKSVYQNFEVSKDTKVEKNFVLEVGGIVMGGAIIADPIEKPKTKRHPKTSQTKKKKN